MLKRNGPFKITPRGLGWGFEVAHLPVCPPPGVPHRDWGQNVYFVGRGCQKWGHRECLNAVMK